MAVMQIEDGFDQLYSGPVILDHGCLLPVCNQAINSITLTGPQDCFACLYETKVADATLRDRDQSLPEGCGMDPIANGHTSAARFVLTGGHSLRRDKEVVQPSQARKADLVRGIQQI